MKHMVECYAGSTNPEEPRAFTWENQRYTVTDVLERRRTPEGKGFLVNCEPGSSRFDLFYVIQEDCWQIHPKGYNIIKESSQT